MPRVLDSLLCCFRPPRETQPDAPAVAGRSRASSLQGTGQTPWGAICAGSSIAVLPLLVMFALASRRLIEGLTAGAVKA